MSIINYLKEKSIQIILILLSYVISTGILHLFNVKNAIIVLIWGILLFCYISGLCFDYYRMNHFYSELLLIFKELDEKTYITDVVKEPHFFSGQVFYKVLKDATKVMNDNIANFKIAQRNYHDYIELWVHEIKTPITAINLIMANNKSPISHQIQSEINRIEGYVEQTLYYARSNTLYKDYRIETISLSSIVNSAIKSCSMSIIGFHGTIQMKDLELDVTTDPKWIIFILKQLIDNAIKYRSDNLRISFDTKQLVSGTSLYVHDNGIGIPQEDISRVFDRGFTGQHGRAYMKSTGMGLYLCKILCEKLGLNITVQFSADSGTTMMIFFPNKLKIFEA
ncbi:MAG: sensor histidine kinase [Clostridium sp.]|uniref:sensor histidine kinase n=1 Tax=Clostridium sp. TaxID=1506 RepID=UPI003D6D6CD7